MSTPVPTSLSLSQMVAAEHRVAALSSLMPDRIIEELLQSLRGTFKWSTSDSTSMCRAILKREQEATTGIGNRIAVPHMKNCSQVPVICGAFGRSTHGVSWGANDGEPVRLVFLILTPPGGESLHVQAMKKIVRLSRDRKTLDYLIQAPSLSNLEAIFQEVDAQNG
jgi:mannitol/fructose-specific phosphotransferase system IIA component (Ntr-type)